jgi:hypothetical protein
MRSSSERSISHGKYRSRPFCSPAMSSASARPAYSSAVVKLPMLKALRTVSSTLAGEKSVVLALPFFLSR